MFPISAMFIIIYNSNLHRKYQFYNASVYRAVDVKYCIPYLRVMRWVICVLGSTQWPKDCSFLDHYIPTACIYFSKNEIELSMKMQKKKNISSPFEALPSFCDYLRQTCPKHARWRASCYRKGSGASSTEPASVYHPLAEYGRTESLAAGCRRTAPAYADPVNGIIKFLTINKIHVWKCLKQFGWI